MTGHWSFRSLPGAGRCRESEPPGTDTPPAPAQVVLANILSNPLKALAPLLAGLTLPAGTLVLSGILPPQAADVVDAYRQWFEMDAPVIKEGWVRLSGTRLG